MNTLTPFIPVYFPNPATQAEFNDAVLEKLRDRIVANIQISLTTKKIFKHSDGYRLSSSVDAYVENGTIIVHSDYAHFRYQNDGVRSHVMWYMLGKTVPIKDTATGKVVYRKATLSSFLKGKWVHKGYEGKHFIESGINMAMSELPDIIDQVKEEFEELLLNQGMTGGQMYAIADIQELKFGEFRWPDFKPIS